MADAPASPGDGGGSYDGCEYSPRSKLRENDRFLPIANINRIMKKALPANAKVAKDAKETVQECVSEFISFVTSEASDRCQIEKRKTVNGDDLLWSMTTLGFENYIDPLKIYLAKYREIEGSAKAGESSARIQPPAPNAQHIHQGSSSQGVHYTDSQLIPQGSFSQGVQYIDSQFIPQGSSSQDVQYTDSQLIPEGSFSQGVQYTDSQLIPQGSSSQGVQYTDSELIPQGSFSQGVQYTDSQLIPQGSFSQGVHNKDSQTQSQHMMDPMQGQHMMDPMQGPQMQGQHMMDPTLGPDKQDQHKMGPVQGPQ